MNQRCPLKLWMFQSASDSWRNSPCVLLTQQPAGWWLSPTPLKNDGVKVSWDHDLSPIYGKMKNVPNHQPVLFPGGTVVVDKSLNDVSQKTALSTPVEPCIFAQQGLSQRVGKDLKSADRFFYHEKCLEVLDFDGRM